MGKPYDKNNVIKHVLSGYSKEERQQLPEVIERARDSVFAIIINGIEKAMNEFNIRAEKNFENDEG